MLQHASFLATVWKHSVLAVLDAALLHLSGISVCACYSTSDNVGFVIFVGIWFQGRLQVVALVWVAWFKLALEAQCLSGHGARSGTRMEERIAQLVILSARHAQWPTSFHGLRPAEMHKLPGILSIGVMTIVGCPPQAHSSYVQDVRSYSNYTYNILST